MGCDCQDCEAMMQPYLDGMLTDEEVKEAREHLEACPPCDKRYRFEDRLRRFVRVAVDEPMPASLHQRLDDLRTGTSSAT
jgi:anti-sigma factor (TIGR02949 family)